MGGEGGEEGRERRERRDRRRGRISHRNSTCSYMVLLSCYYGNK